jgi:methylthioribulose-1-phosphate dehydratase
LRKNKIGVIKAGMKRSGSDAQLRELICELLRLFYQKDFVSGTGGGICAVSGSNTVLMAPTGVHKERVKPSDLFVVDRRNSQVVCASKNRSLKISECNPIFCAILNQRGAGSVMRSHALSAVLAADLAQNRDRVIFEGLEMLKGLSGSTNLDKHPVPVIYNTAHEPELESQMREVMGKSDYAKTYAILVRDHGAYIWGKDIWETKRHAEIYHFLFEATVARMKK